MPPPSSVISSSLAVSAGERTAAVGGDNLPDALAPLSPSPDEQLMAAYSQVGSLLLVRESLKFYNNIFIL